MKQLKDKEKDLRRVLRVSLRQYKRVLCSDKIL